MELEPDLDTYWSGVKGWIAAHKVSLCFVVGSFLLGLAL